MELHGTIKSFNPYKGWGFVECDGQDAFLHKNNLKGFCPAKGDAVQVTVRQTEKGAVAENVEMVSAPASYYGRIKSYNPNRGFGFITSEAFPDQDVFVLWSDLPFGWGLKGTPCKFSLCMGEKGPAAKKVMLLGTLGLQLQQMEWIMAGWGMSTKVTKGRADKMCWDFKKNGFCRRAADGKCPWEPCNGVKNEACNNTWKEPLSDAAWEELEKRYLALMQQEKELQEQKRLCTQLRQIQTQDPNRTKILRADLTKVGLLGAGGFGVVELWKHQTGEAFAMKQICKAKVLAKNLMGNVMTEKCAMFLVNSDFIIRLYETYTSDKSLDFLMEPALGGDLFSIYETKRFYGSEDHARFYTAGVVCAFDHLHERHIMYRDLKPENLLLNERGHLKVADFGLAKIQVGGKAYTPCGTPEYYAPEVIACTGHSRAVDWWMLGVLISELMSGKPVFSDGAADIQDLFEKIEKGIDAVEFPWQLSVQCIDLVKLLCREAPEDRLPMLDGGSRNIKSHAWYIGFEWGKFENLTLEAPFLPEVRSKTDLSNFNVDPDAVPSFIHVDDGTGWDKDFATSQ